MNSNKLICIGGPIDGEFVAVSLDSFEYIEHEQPDFLPGDIIVKPIYKTSTYRKCKFIVRPKDDVLYFAFKHESLSMHEAEQIIGELIQTGKVQPNETARRNNTF